MRHKVLSMIWFLLCASLLLSPGYAAKRPALTDVSEFRLPEAQNVEFRFGAGDAFSVVVYRHDDLNAELLVAPDGSVTFPLLGRVKVAGKSYSELVAELEEGWRKYYTDASVAVNVTVVNNQKVFVVGEVSNPAVLQLTGEMRVLEALISAGGIHPDAKTENLLLIRGGMDRPELFTVNVDGLLRGDLSQNVSLRRDDILVVPTKTIANMERFFRRIAGILTPFVSSSQTIRNLSTSNVGGTQIFEDAPGPE
jgi:polysaccharide export outer membrane protein